MWSNLIHEGRDYLNLVVLLGVGIVRYVSNWDELKVDA